jgi:hypothetical protein
MLSPVPPDDARFGWLLLGLALATRLAWVIGVHPPEEALFSDMAHYVARAQQLASEGVVLGQRSLAWQAFGTHTLLAIPLWLIGPTSAAGLELAGLLWAGMAALTVVLTHRLARAALPERWGVWPARCIGLVALVWLPLVSHAGFFVSETPYACALTAATLACVRLVESGARPLAAGSLAALAFVLRPQCGLFFALIFALWLLDRIAQRRARPAVFVHVGTREAATFALPLLLALVWSLVRFWMHTGYFGSVAESATMNLTAGRCHNIVTQAFADADALARSEAEHDTQDGRRVSLPGFRALGRRDDANLLSLRPALGHESIKFVGALGDPDIHRAIRARCYAATGVGGQLHYAFVNAALLWFVARPWPESSDARHPELLHPSLRFRDVAAVLAPLGLLGMVLSLAGWRRDPKLALVGLQVLSLLIVSALVFGAPRLRVPHDPALFVLVAGAIGWLLERRIRSRVGGGVT